MRGESSFQVTIAEIEYVNIHKKRKKKEKKGGHLSASDSIFLTGFARTKIREKKKKDNR